MANETVAAADHGVDGADGLGLVGHRVEQRDDQLLARIRDVQPGEAHEARRVDERGQGRRAAAGRVEVDELVVEAKAVLARLVLLQGRRQGALDARADEAAEQ